MLKSASFMIKYNGISRRTANANAQLTYTYILT